MTRISSILALTFCLEALAQQPIPIAYRISTFAGANPTFDRVQALDEYISYPNGLAIDSKGNLYYNDSSRAVIRKVTPEGVLTNYAGNGSSGFSGDGGPANAAQINGFEFIAVDSADNLYLSDTYNLRIRKVTADGTITTVAGNGLYGFSGDGGSARSARFNLLGGVTVDDQNNVYVASTDNRVRRIAADGTVQTVAGTGATGFSGDGGPATQAVFNNVEVAAASAGSFYVLDGYNFRIRKVTSDGIIQTIAGTGVYGANGQGDGGPATQAQLGVVPRAILDGKGGLYFTEPGSNRIRQIRADGIIETVVGTGVQGFSGDGGPAALATLNYPVDLALGADGSLYFSDVFNHRIRRVSPDGIISTYAGRGRYEGDGGYAATAILNDPVGAAFDTQGNFFFSEGFAGRIRKIDSVGVITTYAAGLTYPGMITGDDKGNIFFTDGGVVWRGAPDGTLTKFVSSGLSGNIQGLATDASGTLFIADTSNNLIYKVSPDGSLQTVAGSTRGFSGDGGPAKAAKFSGPEGLAFDKAGNLYVADHFNLRVRRIAPDGAITTIAGNGRLSYLDNGWPGPQGDGGPARLAQLFGPERVAVDPGGSIFIGEHSNGFYNGNRIRRVTPDGIIDTVAGTGDYGFTGDGGPARDAQLNWVSQLAADASGQIYFADRLNYRIRVLTPLYGSVTPQNALRR